MSVVNLVTMGRCANTNSDRACCPRLIRADSVEVDGEIDSMSACTALALTIAFVRCVG